nr:hypothetical protein GCM10020092_046840 [Actinoplanes digitatis]
MQPPADLGGVVVPRLQHRVADPGAVVSVRVGEAAYPAPQALLQLLLAAHDLLAQLGGGQHVERVVQQAVVADLDAGVGDLGQLVPAQQGAEVGRPAAEPAGLAAQVPDGGVQGGAGAGLGEDGHTLGEEVAVTVVEGDREESVGAALCEQVERVGEPDEPVAGGGERAELLGEALAGHGEITQRAADRGHGVIHERRHGLPCRRCRDGHRSFLPHACRL